MRQDRGISLVELIVAVLILSIGTVGALRSLDRSAKAVAGNADRAIAALVAANEVEAVRAFGPNVPRPGLQRMAGKSYRVFRDVAPASDGAIRIRVRVEGPRNVSVLRVITVAEP